LPAQITLTNPSFPQEESITYIRSSEHGSEMVHVEMHLVEPGQDGTGDTEHTGQAPTRQYYRYHQQSDSKDMLVKLYAE
jgi:hypothetical protein